MDNFNVALAGVKIATKILNIPEPEIFITSEINLSNKEITGYYSFENNEIVFNEDWINRSSWIEVMITSIHESRHAYQGYCIRTKSRESLETIVKWEFETLNYIMPSGKNNEIDDEDYLKQEIEIDAITFTHYKIYEFFGVKTIVPDVIKDKVFI